MEIAEHKLSQIEEILYKKEEEKIRTALRAIGNQLRELFMPYYREDGRGIESDFATVFSEYIKETAFADTGYYGGCYTVASANERADRMPEKMKAAILKKICADFLDTVENVEDVCNQIQ